MEAVPDINDESPLKSLEQIKEEDGDMIRVSNDTQPPCKVEVIIKTDDHPREISWQIVEVNKPDEVLMTGGGYERVDTYTESGLLMHGNEYQFKIEDCWGDGICCDSGSGNYTVKSGNSIIAEGGDFEDEDVTTFKCDTYMLIGNTLLQTEDFFLIGSIISSPEYTITFTLRPLGIKEGWTNILRFANTTSDFSYPIYEHGQRSPGLYFYPSAYTLHLAHSLKNGEQHWFSIGEELNQNQDYEMPQGLIALQG